MRKFIQVAVLGCLSACGPVDDGAGLDFANTDGFMNNDAHSSDANLEFDANGDGQIVSSEDAQAADGAGVYGDLGESDSGTCLPPNTGGQCDNPIELGCLSGELCGAGGRGNGVDDNCNGQVDETCACNPGDVQRCFLGPPARRHVGACQDGLQTCQGLEFGAWGPCLGGIQPSTERCDKLDNDCNGCADDGRCCGGTLVCPATVPDIQPFAAVTYQGNSYFSGQAAAWSWTVEGGPCDQLFKATTGSPAKQSFVLTGAGAPSATFSPTLSGDYTVTMTATGTDGNPYRCQWIQHVAGKGVRVELCWDHSGEISFGPDLDLNLHRPSTTTNWFSTAPGGECNPDGNVNADDCNYCTCKPQTTNVPRSIWGYANSNIAACINTKDGPKWQEALGACPNPRLDIDNQDIVGRPENINVDTPGDGETFRIMVHYRFSGFDFQTQMPIPLTVHPLVNIYCGGRLKSTFGQSPDVVTGFDHGASWNSGLMWRVADITTRTSGSDVDCEVQKLHLPSQPASFYVTNNDSSY